MNKKKLKIASVILAFVLCFPLNSLYHKIPNFITSIFSPTNRSIWEHMKVLFGSILLTGIAQKIYMILKKEKITNICFSNFIGALSSIPIFLMMFLPLYYTIGCSQILTIILHFITITISEIISYIIMNKRDFGLENITIIFAITVYIIFAILTYHPLKIGVFIDPIL